MAKRLYSPICLFVVTRRTNKKPFHIATTSVALVSDVINIRAYSDSILSPRHSAAITRMRIPGKEPGDEASLSPSLQLHLHKLCHK